MFEIDTKNNEFKLVGANPENITNRLEKGMYNLIIRNTDGPFAPPVISFAINNDYKKGVRLNTGIFKECRNFFNEFFDESLAKARSLLNMRNKLGVMFNGDPGTGKTFLAGQIADEVCDKYDAIGILVTQAVDYSGLIDRIRQDDKDRTIILIIDEFEKTFDRYDTNMLSFLSGAKERDNLIIIATVNDTDRLPSFIKDRPSRFEKIFEFTFNDDNILKSIITGLIPTGYESKIDLVNLVAKIKKHKNTSIDRIKHILRDVIASVIDKEEKGITRKVIINKDDSKISRPVVSGFNKDNSKELVEICVTDNKPKKIDNFEQLAEICKN